MGFKEFMTDPVGSISNKAGQAGGEAAAGFISEIPWGKIVMGLGVVVILAAITINQVKQ